jgi:hypothetical protein
MASTINGTSTGNGGIITTGDDSGILQLQTNETTAVTIDASQNVGIGTSSPTNLLHVSTTNAGSNNYNMRLMNLGTTVSTAVGALWTTKDVGSNNISSAIISTTTDATSSAGGTALSFSTTGLGALEERMRINSSGNLLVGATSTISGSGANLQVTGAALSPVGAFNSQQIGGIFYFYYSGSLVGNISTNGSNLTLNSTSDYRRKENVQPLLRALEKVSALRPVSYKWKDTGLDGQGFIAHELQEIIPECVTGEKDAVETYIDEEGNEQTRPIYQGIDTSFLVATLTAAIQELKAELDAAKADIATLKGAA